MDLNEAMELIHQYSPPGGLVMDMFAGTLVTSLASVRLNRRCVAVEIDRNCVDPAISRLKEWYKWLKSIACLIRGQFPLKWSSFLVHMCVCTSHC